MFSIIEKFQNEHPYIAKVLKTLGLIILVFILTAAMTNPVYAGESEVSELRQLLDVSFTYIQNGINSADTIPDRSDMQFQWGSTLKKLHTLIQDTPNDMTMDQFKELSHGSKGELKEIWSKIHYMTEKMSNLKSEDPAAFEWFKLRTVDLYKSLSFK